jgi:hypothetical protein
MQDNLRNTGQNSLYDRFVVSRRFIASIEDMREFLRAAEYHDFTVERSPCHTAGLVVFTCVRLGDTRLLPRMCEIVERYGAEATGWHAQFYRDYVLAAAGHCDMHSLAFYIRAEGRDGGVAAVRTASLAFYLRDVEMLEVSVERLSPRYPRCLEFQEWEYELASTMLQVLKENKDAKDMELLKRLSIAVGTLQRIPDLPKLEPDMTRYFNVDHQVLKHLTRYSSPDPDGDDDPGDTPPRHNLRIA